ncbi:MAG: LCP family protein [Cellulosilyticaceae bacterium]
MNKKKLWKIFWITFGVCLILFGTTAAVGITAYNVMVHEKAPSGVTVIEKDPLEVDPTVLQKEEELVVTEKVPEEQLEDKTVAILGTDKDGSRTDVVLVAHFNSRTNGIDVISVPRDTKVDWKTDQRACLPEYYSWVKTSKINEMTHYSEMRHVRGTVVNELEVILGNKIDNYVIVSLDSFRRIVDAVGGVDLDVPIRMKKDDYAQDLHIDLYPGFQHLDGDKAEQFVRFRDYLDGDVGRIAAQQQFLNALAEKILSPQIITRIPQIASVLFTSVRTDIAFLQIGEYLPYVKNIDMGQIRFHTLPGEGRYEGNVSYYFKDQEKIEALTNEVFFEN